MYHGPAIEMRSGHRTDDTAENSEEPMPSEDRRGRPYTLVALHHKKQQRGLPEFDIHHTESDLVEPRALCFLRSRVLRHHNQVLTGNPAIARLHLVDEGGVDAFWHVLSGQDHVP